MERLADSAVSRKFGEVFVNKARGVACVVSVLVSGALDWFISRARLGKALRAAADNPEAATYMGIEVDRAHGIAFGIGSASPRSPAGWLRPTTRSSPMSGSIS